MDQIEKVNSTLEQIGGAFQDFKQSHNEQLKDVVLRQGQLEADFKARGTDVRPAGGYRIPREFSDELRQLAKVGHGSIDIPYSPQMAITVGNESAEVLRGIDDMARRTSPIMSLVKNVQSTTGNIGYIVTDTAASGGWVAEGGSRTETTTPTFNKVDPSGNFCYARPKISEEALMDSSFNLAEFIVEESGRIIGQFVGAGIVSGTGGAQPTGFLYGNTVSPLTIVSTSDTASPQRAFGSIQYLPTGNASGFQTDWAGGTASPVQDPSGVLFDALYALNPAYRGNSTWLMNSTTLATIRKMRDSDGNYLFTPGLRSGEDAMILGRPVVIAEDMPDPAANAIPVAIADWSRAYLLVSVGGLRITVDDNITTPGQVLYYVRRRYQGAVLDSQAVKVIRCSVT